MGCRLSSNSRRFPQLSYSSFSPGCPKSTRTPDKVETLKRESIHHQLRQSPRLHETSSSPCNKYRIGRKEVADRNINDRQGECIDNLKDTCKFDSIELPNSSQTEQRVKTPRQKHQSTEDYRRELKNLEDCWNKDFSTEHRNTPRHLRWRAKETNDEISSERDKPIESSESMPGARLRHFQIETLKTSNSGTKRGTDMQTVSLDEWRTSRSRTEGSANKRKSQRIEMNTTPVGKQRTKRTINFYDSYEETRPVLQDKTSVNYESSEQNNGSSSDGRKLKKDIDQIEPEMYIIEKGYTSDEQQTDLTVKVKRSNRWNDDSECYQYKRRKKLRSEVTKEELWDGFPLNVCFKRQPQKQKSIKCTEICGNDNMEIKVLLSAPKEVSFDESNKSGNASVDISRSGISMAPKDRTSSDTEAKMEKLSHNTDIAQIEAPVYESHKSHVIINVSLKKTTILDGDSDLNASEEDTLLADSKSNLLQSLTGAVSEIDSATEMELLREDSAKMNISVKNTQPDLTNLPQNTDATLPVTECYTQSLDTCVKNDLHKDAKTYVSTKYKLNGSIDKAGLEIVLGAKESYLSIKNSTAESKDDPNDMNQNDMLTTEEGMKEINFNCKGGYTCSCNNSRENTTHLLNGGEVINILNKVEHCGVNIDYKSEETISHDTKYSKICEESVEEDVSGCHMQTIIAMERIEESSGNKHEQCHVTPTVSELIQESMVESGLKVLPAKKDTMQDIMSRRTPSRKRKKSDACVITPKRSARLQEKSLRTPYKDEFCFYTRIKINDQSIKTETAAPSGNYSNTKLEAEDKNVEELHVDDPAVHSEVDIHVPSAVNIKAVSTKNTDSSRNTWGPKIRIDSVAKELYLDLRSAGRMQRDNHDPFHGVSYTVQETVLTESSKVPRNDVKTASEETKIHPSIIEMDDEAIEPLSKNRVMKGVTRIAKSKLCYEYNEEGFNSDNTKNNVIALQDVMKKGKSKQKILCKKGQNRSTSEAKLTFNETENIVSKPEEINNSAIEDKNKNSYSKAKLCNFPQESNSKEDGDTISLKPNDWQTILGRSSTRTRVKNSNQIDVISGYSDKNPSNKNKGKIKEKAKFLNKPIKFDQDIQHQIMEVNQKGLLERILRQKKCSVVQDSNAKISSMTTRNQRSKETDKEKKSEELNTRIIDCSEKAEHNANAPNRTEFECNGSISSYSDNSYHENKVTSTALSGMKEISSNAITSNRKEFCDAGWCLESVVAKGKNDSDFPIQDSSLRSSKSNQRVTSPRTITDESRSTIKALISEEEPSLTSSNTPNIFNNFCELFAEIAPKINCVDTDKDKKLTPISTQSLPSSSSNVKDLDKSDGKRSTRSKGPKTPKKHCELNATSNKVFDPKVDLCSLCSTSESDYDSDVRCEYPITESRSDHSYSASSYDVSVEKTDRNQTPEIKQRIKMKYHFKSRSKNALIREKLNFAFRQQSRKFKETDSKAQEISYDKNKMSTRSTENTEQNESTKTKGQIVSGVLDKKKCNKTPNKTSKGWKDDRCHNSDSKKSR
ncbi:hypothetical protein CHS0354_013488 [Potamilus streckersoni]|uniref:Uncharacterized protein n=1 Tax=Potamilus streckersoni TaxID=2493646 RepID=A0AAE0T8F4_9BIVA|nr:hypothetical protein CHS0354_013488 [Potamilus streckersoni]